MIKHRSTAFALLTLSLIIFHPRQVDAAPINVLTNGGFETGALGPWYQTSSSSSGENWNVAAAAAHSGSFGATDVGNKQLRQNFAAVATEDIFEVSFWFQHPAFANLAVAASFYYQDGTFEDVIRVTNGTNWTFFDITNQLDTGKVLVGFAVWGNTSGRANFDDASILVDDGQQVVPEPGTLLLLGSGLIVAARSRLRRGRQV